MSCRFLQNLVVLLVLFNVRKCDENDIIKSWSHALGSELWSFATKCTNINDIKQQYKNLNVQIEERNPEDLLNLIVQNIERKIDEKLSALEKLKNSFENHNFDCSQTSEQIENFSYVSMKMSKVLRFDNESNRLTAVNIVGDDQEDDDDDVAADDEDKDDEDDNGENGDNDDDSEKNLRKFLPLFLQRSERFSNISVDLEQSCVHVPTNIFDERKDIQCKIELTKKLDKVFKENYQKQNTVSWQNFCSSLGISRIYPGIKYVRSNTNDVDLFDCRKEPWFVESVTGRNNVIILFDNSGSMTGIHKHIAQLAINLMLDTFSNHDFINVYNFSEQVRPLVSCFGENLVRATPNSLKIFKDHLDKVHLEGHENFTQLFHNISAIFAKFQKTNNNTNRNIAIIFTDNLPLNITDELSNNENIEIFFYLIGRDIMRSDFMHLSNTIPKENFFHLQSLEEVIEQVIKYVPVIGKKNYQLLKTPYTWSHLFKSNKHKNYTPLSIALSSPIYKKEIGDLIGAVAIDILVNEEFYRYSRPHLTGVNGQAFIINDNGFIIMHEKLKYDSLLKSFNSIDLIDIENVLEESVPQIERLREQMIERRTGKIESIKMILHFERMTKAFVQEFDYYYAPLAYTPYSIAVSLPKLHGFHAVKVTDEIKRISLLKLNPIAEFFADTNWNIHPNWIYCQQKNPDSLTDETQRTQVINYLRSLESRKPFRTFNYTCDDDLIKNLIFDARLTRNIWRANDREPLLANWNVSLRFLATTSGLVRWSQVSDNSGDRFLADNLIKSIDMDWFKIAVFYHAIDAESFVYSLTPNSRSVIATHAVFPRDAGREAPGLVAGVIFARHAFAAHVNRIVADVSQSKRLSISCQTGEFDCFAIDHFGYVLYSSSDLHVGDFLGEIDGAVMQKLLDDSIFVRTVLNNSQKMCTVQKLVTSGAFSLRNLSDWFANFVQSALLKLTMLVYRLAAISWQQPQQVDYADTFRVLTKRSSKSKEDDEYFNRKIEPVYKDVEEPCFETMDRYFLRSGSIGSGSANTKFTSVKYQSSAQFIQSNCSRPFFYVQIPHSNLVLIVVKALFPTCYRKISIEKESHFKKFKLNCFYE